MKIGLSRRLGFGAFPAIVTVLIISCSFRLGSIGYAIASEPPDQQLLVEKDESSTCMAGAEIEMLLDAISERTSLLDKREETLAKRSERIDAAQILVENNLKRLTEAENSLANTIAQVDGASENDLSRLTSVYESMKPKVAASLFEQMDSEFAAGFLGRMNPQAAAGIMSNLSTEVGYAISVVLAGRNALAPKD